MGRMRRATEHVAQERSPRSNVHHRSSRGGFFCPPASDQFRPVAHQSRLLYTHSFALQAGASLRPVLRVLFWTFAIIVVVIAARLWWLVYRPLPRLDGSIGCSRPAKRRNRRARPLGRTAYPREFCSKTWSRRRATSWPRTALANGSAPTGRSRPTLRDSRSGHPQSRQAIPNPGFRPCRRTRRRPDGPRLSFALGSLRSRRQSISSNSTATSCRSNSPY